MCVAPLSQHVESRPSRLVAYLKSLRGRTPTRLPPACLATLDHVGNTLPTVADAIVEELRAQRSGLKLISQ